MKRKSKVIAMVVGFGTLGGLVDTGLGTVCDGYETPNYSAVTTLVFTSGGANSETMALVMPAKMRPGEVRIEVAWPSSFQSSSPATPDTAILDHRS